MKKRKKNRRSENKFPALNPRLNIKARANFMDFDYINQLPETWTDPITGKKYNPKEYLNAFSTEYYVTDFTTNEKRIHPKKKVPHPKNPELEKLIELFLKKIAEFIESLNNTKMSMKSKVKIKKAISKFKNQIRKQIKADKSYILDYYKKESEDKNNSQNRCILNRATIQNKIHGFADLPESYYIEQGVEDRLINEMDIKSEFPDHFEDSED